MPLLENTSKDWLAELSSVWSILCLFHVNFKAIRQEFWKAFTASLQLSLCLLASAVYLVSLTLGFHFVLFRHGDDRYKFAWWQGRIALTESFDLKNSADL